MHALVHSSVKTGYSYNVIGFGYYWPWIAVSVGPLVLLQYDICLSYGLVYSFFISDAHTERIKHCKTSQHTAKVSQQEN